MILFEISLLLISLCKNEEKAVKLLEKIKLIDIKNNENENTEMTETPFECNLKYHRDSKENFEQRIKWIRQIMEENND